MKAPLDKARKYLGFAVPDTYTMDPDGRIISDGGHHVCQHVTAADLATIDAAEVEAYRADREEAHKAAEAKGEPMPARPVKYLSRGGKLVATKPSYEG